LEETLGDEMDLPRADLVSEFVAKVREIKQVKAVFHLETDDAVFLWTLVEDDMDEDVVFRIYEIQDDICDRSDKTSNFFVFSLKEKDIEGTIPKCLKNIYSRKGK